MKRKFDAIVCLSQIDWDFLWQRTQEVMSQFSKKGYPVLFVENTGVRIPKPTDAGRIWKRLKKQFINRETRSGNQNLSKVQIYSPMAIPFPYSSWAIKWNKNLIYKSILHFSREKKIPLNRILLWSYMTTPLALEIVNAFHWAGVVVDLVSDPCKVPGAAKLIPSQKKMLNLADITLCASTAVKETAEGYMEGSKSDKLCLFEDGFSTRLLSLSRCEWDKGRLAFGDYKAILAYIGGVNDKICWDAVSMMVSDLPDILFAFVGPKSIKRLPCLGANFTWLPSFDEYDQLGNFLKKCNVGLIPYKLGSYVSEMRPAKINEYLVMGLPIVATWLPELERMAQQYGHGIFILLRVRMNFPKGETGNK